MNEDITRRSLLMRVRDAADSNAWVEFDERYRQLIVRFARLRGLQPTDADDIGQAVMAKLSRVLRAFEYDGQKGRFRTYLYRAVRNEVAEQFSRPKQLFDPVCIDTAAAPSSERDADAEAQWEREWESHHLRLAMTTIRATFDEASVALFERLLAGDSTESVAQAFDTTTQAVHKVKQRIRNRVTELISRQVAEEDDPDMPLC